MAVATLARDRATAAYAEKEAARYDTLVKSRSVTREQDDQSQRHRSVGGRDGGGRSAALAHGAKFNLDNTTIRAPITGRTGGCWCTPATWFTRRVRHRSW